MRIKVGLLALLVVFVAVVGWVNRELLAMPAHFNFLLGSTELPLGMVLAGVVLAVGLVFSAYLGVWQYRVIGDYRRQSQALQAQRTLADDAESSRFTALSALMKDELATLEQRMTRALEAVQREVQSSENSLAAQIGEMDDRLRPAKDISKPADGAIGRLS